jgi:uncharacterized glyoxalase superfamily protein PhnB
MPPCTVIPVLGYPDVGAAIDWLRDTFGFKLRLHFGDVRTILPVNGTTS